MATTRILPPPKPGYFTLPGEMRNAIYRMLLTKPYARQHDSIIYAPLHPAILRVNRQLYAEAVNILHGENIWIIATIDASMWPRITAIVPNVSRKGVGNIKYPALHITFGVPTTTSATKTTKTQVTFIMEGEESIEHFLRTLLKMASNPDTNEDFKASSLDLTLCKTPFHTESKLHSTCLLPSAFSVVYEN